MKKLLLPNLIKEKRKEAVENHTSTKSACEEVNFKVISFSEIFCQFFFLSVFLLTTKQETRTE
jgi:hypothetical protein